MQISLSLDFLENSTPSLNLEQKNTQIILKPIENQTHYSCVCIYEIFFLSIT